MRSETTPHGHHPTILHGQDLHAPVVPTDHRRGAQRPNITVIEYGDFQSRACREAEPAVRKILAAHPRTLQLIFRHFPLVDHPLALMAAGKVCDTSGGMGELETVILAS
jgi:protein-disulfide isomerase